jgi:hypothetical protein
MEFRESMAALFVVSFFHIGSCERKQAPQQESYWPAVRKIEETFRPFYADSPLHYRTVVIFLPKPDPTAGPWPFLAKRTRT